MIDELERQGFIDRTRLAIGGHSYGAFTTVNAMVHTPFFKAGIAGDGSYNRTLTPLGFQNERRDLWDAPNVYLGMSPFLYANNLTRRPADVPRPARPECGNGPGELRPPVPCAERPGQDRRHVPYPLRITARQPGRRCSICGRAGPRGSTNTSRTRSQRRPKRQLTRTILRSSAGSAALRSTTKCAIHTKFLSSLFVDFVVFALPWRKISFVKQ